VGYLTVCPPRGPGSIPSHGGVFQGIFPWLIVLCRPVLSQRGRKWLKLPSMTTHNLRTARRKAEVQPRTDNGWLKKKLLSSHHIFNISSSKSFVFNLTVYFTCSYQMTHVFMILTFVFLHWIAIRSIRGLAVRIHTLRMVSGGFEPHWQKGHQTSIRSWAPTKSPC